MTNCRCGPSLCRRKEMIAFDYYTVCQVNEQSCSRPHRHNVGLLITMTSSYTEIMRFSFKTHHTTRGRPLSICALECYPFIRTQDKVRKMYARRVFHPTLARRYTTTQHSI